MQKTPLDIEELKKVWCDDPHWPIEDTRGFEDHYQELREYRLRLIGSGVEVNDPAIKVLRLIVSASRRNRARREFEGILHEDSTIADNMRDYWKNQQAGSA